jgi:hypothetical protein
MVMAKSSVILQCEISSLKLLDHFNTNREERDTYILAST